VLGYHKGDYGKVPNEDAVMDALRKFNLPKGDYMMPRPASMDDMRTADFQAKRARGPVAIFTIMSSEFNMGATMVQWLLYCAVVSLFSGYVGTLARDTDYPHIFQIVGCTAFMGYSLALWPTVIWYQKSLRTVLLQNLDGLIYGLLTAGTFGWLWPR